jgi:hypothetical protein
MLAMSFVSLLTGYQFWQVGRTVKADLSAADSDEDSQTDDFDELMAKSAPSK